MLISAISVTFVTVLFKVFSPELNKRLEIVSAIMRKIDGAIDFYSINCSSISLLARHDKLFSIILQLGD